MYPTTHNAAGRPMIDLTALDEVPIKQEPIQKEQKVEPIEEKKGPVEPPEELCCPIEHTLMRHVVSIPCGHSFEAKAIKEWFKKNKERVCPVCNKPSEPHYNRNLTLKKKIDKWKEKTGYQEEVKEESSDEQEVTPQEQAKKEPLTEEQVKAHVRDIAQMCNQGTEGRGVALDMTLELQREYPEDERFVAIVKNILHPRASHPRALPSQQQASYAPQPSQPYYGAPHIPSPPPPVNFGPPPRPNYGPPPHQQQAPFPPPPRPNYGPPSRPNFGPPPSQQQRNGPYAPPRQTYGPPPGRMQPPPAGPLPQHVQVASLAASGMQPIRTALQNPPVPPLNRSTEGPSIYLTPPPGLFPPPPRILPPPTLGPPREHPQGEKRKREKSPPPAVDPMQLDHQRTEADVATPEKKVEEKKEDNPPAKKRRVEGIVGNLFELVKTGSAQAFKAALTGEHLRATNPEGYSLLDRVVLEKREVRFIDILIDKGFPIDKQGLNGNTALHWASQIKSKRHIVKLLKRGASKSVRNQADLTPAEMCRGKNSMKIRELFEDPEINIRADSEGESDSETKK